MLKRLPQDRLEDESIGAVASFFNSNEWEFNRQTRDKSGIDGEVEIIHGIERTGRLIKCQIKAGASYISSESENYLRIRIERKYLEHWAKMTAPVLVMFYDPATRLIFWKAIREYLDLYPSLLTRATESCLIGFDKDQDRLETESLAALEAMEAGRFRYDNILIERSRSELGWSNWIVLLDPASDRCSRFFQAPILRRPDFLLFQAAMEPFDVAVAFRVMIRRPPMGDAEPPQRLQEARRSELRPVVGRQRQVRLTASRGKPIQHRLLDRSQRVFGPAAMREIPSHDLPCTAVDHAHQICPAHCWPCPDLGHVRLPDLIRLGCFHAAPFFLPSCSQTTRAHQQPTFSHYP